MWNGCYFKRGRFGVKFFFFNLEMLKIFYIFVVFNIGIVSGVLFFFVKYLLLIL